MYKKIYLEITNNCNLKCDFCMHNRRKQKFMTFDEFKTIISKIKGHTNYIYLHVLGEPLLHPNINEFINYAKENDINVNITTNGYLINRIKDNNNIRQINISLQSFNPDYLTLEDYLSNIFSSIDKLKENTYISLRLWVNNENTKDIISMINMKYDKDISFIDNNSNVKLEDNVFLSFHNEFIWPSLENDFLSTEGTCYALKDHIGILSDGTIVPCCLDGDGIINLGNIFSSSLEEIQSTKRYKDMLECFKNNYKCEELCQRCNFIQK